jgi:hypothetical protein
VSQLRESPLKSAVQSAALATGLTIEELLAPQTAASSLRNFGSGGGGSGSGGGGGGGGGGTSVGPAPTSAPAMAPLSLFGSGSGSGSVGGGGEATVGFYPSGPSYNAPVSSFGTTSSAHGGSVDPLLAAAERAFGTSLSTSHPL